MIGDYTYARTKRRTTDYSVEQRIDRLDVKLDAHYDTMKLEADKVGVVVKELRLVCRLNQCPQRKPGNQT